MKKSLELKLEQLLERYQELSLLLAEPDIINDQNKFRELSREYASLGDLATAWHEYTKVRTSLADLEALLQEETDVDMRLMTEEELSALKQQLEDLDTSLQSHLLPVDPDDKRNIYLEIRAGTGGDEAAIFAGDLFRMYSRYAEKKRWQIEIINVNHGEHGGFKEIIARISGTNVYAELKFEAGTHRVQRVPETESQGRIHTSACTVAILPEVDEINDITLNQDDLRVDTYRSSGAGGQHVNKTDSAIRITHLPTGIVVECQDERSQHKNRAKAMSLLKSRLLNQEQAKQKATADASRKLQVGSGDRSERIRTYNYPQGRVTDHRINLVIYQLPEIIAGDLGMVVEPLLREHQAELLAELAKS